LGRRSASRETPSQGGIGQTGRVIGHLGVAVEVALTDGQAVRARVARGADVVVGDRVTLVDGRVVVAERATTLVRRAAHGVRPQILAANVDTLCLLVTREPPPRVHFVDRAVVMARASGIAARVVVTKTDLDGGEAYAEEVAATYAGSLDVRAVSIADEERVAALERSFSADETVAFVGPSGVGKSTLTNRLCPSADLATAALSDATGRGRHTTSKATLSRAPRGFLVVDMPGVRDFGLVGLTKDELARHFPGFEDAGEDCRYTDCLHREEPGCAVTDAHARGLVRADRLRAYRLLLDEVA